MADSSSGSSTGFSCELVDAEPPRVPADIAVLIDTDVPPMAVMAALGTLSDAKANNLAIIVPEGIAASVEVPVTCFDGCGSMGCPATPNRIILPYSAESPYDTLEMLDLFDCVFRDPLAETSGPVSNLWFITHRPDLMPPEQLASIVLDGTLRLRVHVSCPECDDDLFNANSLLKEVVVESGGTVSDYENLGAMLTQLTRLGEERHSCVWATDEDPRLLEFSTDAGNEILVERVSDIGECAAEDAALAGGDGAFFPTEFGVGLCPDTCRIFQSAPATSVQVDECI